MSRPIVVLVRMLAPANRGSFNRSMVRHVPVTSTASTGDTTHCSIQIAFNSRACSARQQKRRTNAEPRHRAGSSATGASALVHYDGQCDDGHSCGQGESARWGGKGPAAMHAMPTITEAEATLLALPRSRTIQEVRPFCTSNIAQQYRSILAHPGQQLYPPNGSCFNFSDRH
jgi:hypothetical protein